MSLTGMLKWATDLMATIGPSLDLLNPLPHRGRGGTARDSERWVRVPPSERPLTPTLSPGGGEGVSKLEPYVGWRQAEFGAAEDGGGAFEVGAGMRLHRVDVAPGALDRVGEEDGAAARGHHQPVDGADAPIDRLAGIPPGAGAQREGDLLAGAGEAHHRGEIGQHAVMRGVDLGGRLGEAQLSERILGDAPAIADIDPALLLLAERREGAGRHPD